MTMETTQSKKDSVASVQVIKIMEKFYRIMSAIMGNGAFRTLLLVPLALSIRLAHRLIDVPIGF